MKIVAQTRQESGKQNNQLRQQGFVPAVLYGHGVDNINLSVKAQEAEKTYKEAGSSTLVDLVVADKEPVKVLLHDVQFDPIRDVISHIDFYQVNMKEKIETAVQLVFTGTAQAVKELNGTLVHNLEEIDIRCLPGDLIHEIVVDVSGLNTFDDSVKVSDLKIPDAIEIVGHDANDVLATVTPPRIEEEVIVAATEEAEGEEGEEGEAKEGEEGEAKEGEGEKKEPSSAPDSAKASSGKKATEGKDSKPSSAKAREGKGGKGNDKK